MSLELPYHDKASAWSSHTQLAKHCRALPAGSRVLDVGTASGTLARMCQNTSLRFFGIEPHRDWAQVACHLYEKIWICSIEDMEDEFLRGYDLVVLGDVLEHLSDSQATLERIVNAQPSCTLFLISVPNVANFWIRLNLLFGHFDYTDRGILDRTHLRFFTRKSLLQMLKNVGLDVSFIQVTPLPLEAVSPFFNSRAGAALHAILAFCTNLWPTFLGYQFIVGAKKS